jgi:hypothetical protein
MNMFLYFLAEFFVYLKYPPYTITRDASDLPCCDVLRTKLDSGCRQINSIPALKKTYISLLIDARAALSYHSKEANEREDHHAVGIF